MYLIKVQFLKTKLNVDWYLALSTWVCGPRAVTCATMSQLRRPEMVRWRRNVTQTYHNGCDTSPTAQRLNGCGGTYAAHISLHSRRIRRRQFPVKRLTSRYSRRLPSPCSSQLSSQLLGVISRIRKTTANLMDRNVPVPSSNGMKMAWNCASINHDHFSISVIISITLTGNLSGM